MAKLVNLDVVETSGVDAPAHLDPGWLVIKNEGVAVADDTTEPTDVDPVAETEVVPDERDARIAELEAALAAAQTPAEVDAEAEVEELAKEAPEPLAKAFTDMRSRLEKAEAQLALARDRETLAEAEGFVKGLDHLALPDTTPSLIKSLRDRDTDLADQVEGLLTSVNAQATAGDLFKEVGSTTATSGDAWDRIEALAKSKVESGEAKTMQQGRSLAALENPSLYNELKG